jgi:hypothetical protein
VSLHCNLDKDTHHLMNASRLKMMKPNAVLVNAARGPVIDEAALVAHLKANPEFRWVGVKRGCISGVRSSRQGRYQGMHVRWWQAGYL